MDKAVKESAGGGLLGPEESKPVHFDNQQIQESMDSRQIAEAAAAFEDNFEDYPHPYALDEDEDVLKM